MEADPLGELRQVLADVPSGLIPPSGPLRDQVEVLLAGCWSNLSGDDTGGMDGSKIQGRTKELRWFPPDLLFEIERHSGSIPGSTMAAVQAWSIDIVSGIARLVWTARRRNPKP